MTADGGKRDTPARISVIAFPSGDVVFDEWLIPQGQPHNLRHKVSGATTALLDTAEATLDTFYRWMERHVGPDTIFILHAHVNDFLALQTIPTDNVIDTARVFQNPALPRAESSLAGLVEAYLPVALDRTDGHSSVDDATATADLVKWILEEGEFPQSIWYPVPAPPH